MIQYIIAISCIAIGLASLLMPGRFAKIWRPKGLPYRTLAEHYGQEKAEKYTKIMGIVFIAGGILFALFWNSIF